MENDQAQNNKYIVITLGSLVVIAAILFFLYERGDGNIAVRNPSAGFEKLHGYIYYNDDDEETLRSRIMGYDLSKKTSWTVLDNTQKYMTSPVPLEGGRLAYLSAQYDPDSRYAYPYSDYKTMTIAAPSGNIEALFENLEVSLIRNIRWSPTEKHFAWNGISQEQTRKEKEGERPNYKDIKNYSVYIGSTNGEFSEIEGAVSPRWFQDGKYLYYIKADGLYEHDRETGNTTRVVSFRGITASYNATFSFTPDWKFLIIGESSFDRLYVYSIVYTNPLKARLLRFRGAQSAASPYDIFPLGDSDQVGFVWYDREGVATITLYDVSEDNFFEIFSIKTNKGYRLEPMWSNTLLLFK